MKKWDNTMGKMAQSIEPNIADLGNSWLKSYNLDYKLEQESLNTEIDKALSDYFTKNGGAGANCPDAKLLLKDKNFNYYPILIEYKGYKDKLVKLDSDGQVENRTNKNEPHLRNINSFAVNGAVHYANAILHHTSYTGIIAIGMTGYKDETGKIRHEIGVYYVSKSNFGVGQIVGEFSDFSFLAPKNFDEFIEKVKTLNLSQEEIDKLKEQREKEIDASLVKLNNDIYQNEKGLGENDRVYLVAASIIATIGIPNEVPVLEKNDLKSQTFIGGKDGDILINRINAFLNKKDLPQDKKDLIIRTLSNTLLTENINKVENGESQLKRVFSKIVDDLGIYYKIGLTTDFTGKLFNEMYSWLGFSQDKLNDVVLTPSYIATLLVKLARVNKDSYVWDFAAGSAGLLVAAMNEMLVDAKNNITSPQELTQKEIKIRTEQLLGLELLSSVYMLAILNMILMGDGSSNILNKDSIKDFDGNYGFGQTNSKFPADAFVLNPPYSANGNGMNFVEKALGMMNKGYAAIIIQNSAGSGRAKEYNKKILEKHTLLASIKMPIDLFIGKSSVQTNIYVFKVNEKHHKDEIVKFIDFSNDGYTRTNRKKSSNNLKDTDCAKERYEELVNLVRFGKSKLNIFTEKEYYEGTIDPKNGSDWNQTAPIDTKPTLQDFKKTVSDYLAWEVSNILRQQSTEEERLGK
ncbi:MULTISPECIES: HsdM family class I SAM-dependent methyltransferase [Microcystis]|nr:MULTISPECIES: N-6 DNA methylase [Microcystis]UGS11252.1 SAM-dependent methyltransferase [Microcystis aeruginosa FACHB-905 = DIANCHI905]WKX62401.1 N-6 DNA methylase [Microcystis aeruginosa PCC 7806]